MNGHQMDVEQATLTATHTVRVQLWPWCAIAGCSGPTTRISTIRTEQDQEFELPFCEEHFRLTKPATIPLDPNWQRRTG